jgi:hypothetical protein
MKRGSVAAAVLALCVASCSSAPVAVQPPASTATTSVDGGDCASRTPVVVGPGVGPEVTGITRDAQLHGLLFSAGPVQVGDELKVVWRMTGSGPLEATAVAPDGATVPLAWGPEAHGGSSYDRPGDEWGVGYRFTQPGCWQLHLARDDVRGDVWLEVAPIPVPSASAVQVPCDEVIDSVAAPPSGYEAVADAVALATGPLQAEASGEADPGAARFAKSGLLVRAGAAVDLVAVGAPGQHATIGWGSPARRSTHVRVAGCPRPADGAEWLAFAGGYWVDQPQCLSVVTDVGGEQRATFIGIGATCG